MEQIPAVETVESVAILVAEEIRKLKSFVENSAKQDKYREDYPGEGHLPAPWLTMDQELLIKTLETGKLEVARELAVILSVKSNNGSDKDEAFKVTHICGAVSYLVIAREQEYLLSLSRSWEKLASNADSKAEASYQAETNQKWYQEAIMNAKEMLSMNPS